MSGDVDVTPIADKTQTGVRISLPIASGLKDNFSNLAGTAVSALPEAVVSHITAHQQLAPGGAAMFFTSSGTRNIGHVFHFTYVVN